MNGIKVTSCDIRSPEDNGAWSKPGSAEQEAERAQLRIDVLTETVEVLTARLAQAEAALRDHEEALAIHTTHLEFIGDEVAALFAKLMPEHHKFNDELRRVLAKRPSKKS